MLLCVRQVYFFYPSLSKRSIQSKVERETWPQWYLKYFFLSQIGPFQPNKRIQTQSFPLCSQDFHLKFSTMIIIFTSMRVCTTLCYSTCFNQNVSTTTNIIRVFNWEIFIEVKETRDRVFHRNSWSQLFSYLPVNSHIGLDRIRLYC